MYIPIRFKAYELVDKETYDTLSDKAFEKIDERLLKFIDNLSKALEEFYSIRIRLVCNNWHWHKNPKAADYFQWRGWRNENYKLFNKNSFHGKIPCKALDLDSPDLPAKALINFVLLKQNEDWCKDIGGVEIGVNWLHVDLRKRSGNKIITFRA